MAAALIAPLFVLALPILDVSLAILRRGLRGLPLFRPDRSHIHHHLLNMGLSRRTAVSVVCLFTLVFLVLGFAVYGSQGRWLPVLAGAAILIVLLAAGKLSFSREWFAVGHVVGNSLRMREEIAYTISLTGWLVLEARRVETLGEFWKLFVFSVERLASRRFPWKPTQAGSDRRRDPPTAGEEHKMLFDFRDAGAGSIEFRAARSEGPSPDLNQPRNSEPCIGEERAFQVISELMAEAWLKASRQLHASQAGNLGSQPAAPSPAPEIADSSDSPKGTDLARSASRSG